MAGCEQRVGEREAERRARLVDLVRRIRALQRHRAPLGRRLVSRAPEQRNAAVGAARRHQLGGVARSGSQLVAWQKKQRDHEFQTFHCFPVPQIQLFSITRTHFIH